jgi:hypothetical protein
MTKRDFEASAKRFVAKALREASGKGPSRSVISRTTAKIVNNFRPFLSSQEGERRKSTSR